MDYSMSQQLDCDELIKCKEVFVTATIQNILNKNNQKQ
jgi:hypothetical protein